MVFRMSGFKGYSSWHNGCREFQGHGCQGISFKSKLQDCQDFGTEELPSSINPNLAPIPTGAGAQHPRAPSACSRITLKPNRTNLEPLKLPENPQPRNEHLSGGGAPATMHPFLTTWGYLLGVLIMREPDSFLFFETPAWVPHLPLVVEVGLALAWLRGLPQP